MTEAALEHAKALTDVLLKCWKTEAALEHAKALTDVLLKCWKRSNKSAETDFALAVGVA